ncbi:MAG: NifU family protein [Alphaproteobacteria bacterium]
MFVQTEDTPNPATLKFIPGIPVMTAGTVEFTSAEKAERSPLARRLFGIAGVKRIFFGADFITVTKESEREWQVMKPAILGAIMEHFTSGRAVVEEVSSNSPALSDDDDDIVRQIKDLLESRVRPAVAADGGDIVFDRFEEGIVYLEMRGACSGCPSSLATLKMGIENMLRHYVPEVIEVRAA